MKNKEEAIKACIQEITGVLPTIRHGFISDEKIHVRPYRIKTILLLASSYDFFLLEEEGRLQKLFQSISSLEGIVQYPEITHVETGDQCIEFLQSNAYDILIVFNTPEGVSFPSFSKIIKETHSTLPIVLLANNTVDLANIQKADTTHSIDYLFTWNGDGKILVAIVQLLEDKRNIHSQIPVEEPSTILLIEDSIQYYSSYITMIYEELWKYTDYLMKENIDRIQKTRRYQRIPFVVHTTTFDEAKEVYENFKDGLLCIISDNHQSEKTKEGSSTGFEFVNMVRKQQPTLPIILQSSEPIDKKQILPENVQFILKSSPHLAKTIKKFIDTSFGPKIISLKDKSTGKTYILQTLDDFQKALLSINGETLKETARSHQFSTWLKTLRELDLANRIYLIESTELDPKQLQENLLEVFEEYHYSLNQISISNFTRHGTEPQAKIIRIGGGALGGKARGLAFLAKILSKYITPEMFADLKITIPRTIVLSTDIFDAFLEQNDIVNPSLFELSDKRIAAAFMKGNLPATIIGDLRSFVRNTRKPLIIRSSGVLEDSMLQPFAGIYASVLLPNESWETDLRFQEVVNAIKYVYASTYFEKARTYLKSTPKHIGDEKMAVIIQEVVGRKHQHYFYPAISGVAKSYNHYPAGPCSPEDGIVYLALGLGKAIVDGGPSYCFCPSRPKAPLCGTPKDFMRYAQSSFYAVNLDALYSMYKKSEESALIQLDIEISKKHGILEHVASTYSPRDDQLYPGIGEEGTPIVNFGSIIEYDSLPLAKAIKLLLRISEIALGYPVEIEFAVTLPVKKNDTAELVILQIRNMMPQSQKCTVDLNKYNQENIICYSENALGNGKIEKISDIIYVKPDTFDMKNTPRIVSQLRQLNTTLMDTDTPYILIGAGRWGSADPWLGIPVIWSDIAGAKVIIETPVEGKTIEPSQGSHFFHDMISSQVGYIIVSKKESKLNWEYIKSLPIITELEDVAHVRTKDTLEIRLDGIQRKAVILKKQ